MTAMGLIVLALAVILLTIPLVLIVTKLLTRPALPDKFLNEEGEINITLEHEINKWRRCQCYWTILGYLLAWIFVVFFTIHTLVMTIIMGESTTDLWLKALLITAIIDYCFLQTIKGLFIMCCLFEDCVDLLLTIFAGHIA